MQAVQPAARLSQMLSLTPVACVAMVAPVLLAFNVPPSATLLNQAVALLGWGMLLVWLSISVKPEPNASLDRAPAAAALAALAILAAAALLAVPRGQPGPLALSSAGTLLAAGIALACGVLAGQSRSLRDPIFRSVCVALLSAGLLSTAVALVQSYAPSWADGNWIARPATPGRAGGNLRQPNHLSSLLVWSLVALAWLHETGFEQPRRAGLLPGRIASFVAMALMTFGIVLTVSRTGMVCVVLLALWGLCDRSLSRFTRTLLCLAPLLYGLAWLLASSGVQTFAGESQIHRSDPSSSRFGIWANAMRLIAQHPWAGVGWGEFNFAWTLTPFPGRPGAFFDHTHNLLLQFLVELGVPLALAVFALLLWALWKSLLAARRGDPVFGGVTTQRTGLVMIVMMAVHSMLEYPLWYAYFLLPMAFVFGICLGKVRVAGDRVDAAAPKLARAVPAVLQAGAALMVVAAVLVVADYRRVVVIFSPPDNAASLSARIADGQRSWFFAHHADYAAGTTAEHPGDELSALSRASHYLLDTRLMMAWARGLEESGDTDRARYVAQRLREFNNSQSDDFFAPCAQRPAAGEAMPFQCLAPGRALSFEDFR